MQQYKIHNDHHPLKNYQAWKETGKYSYPGEKSVSRNRPRNDRDDIIKRQTC